MESFIEQVVADHMTRNVKTVRRDLTLRELGDLFESEDFNTYPVEEGGQVVGLVSKFNHLACFIFAPAHMIAIPLGCTSVALAKSASGLNPYL